MMNFQNRAKLENLVLQKKEDKIIARNNYF